jgi:hypothetical protein
LADEHSGAPGMGLELTKVCEDHWQILSPIIRFQVAIFMIHFLTASMALVLIQILAQGTQKMYPSHAPIYVKNSLILVKHKIKNN